MLILSLRDLSRSVCRQKEGGLPPCGHAWGRTRWPSPCFRGTQRNRRLPETVGAGRVSALARAARLATLPVNMVFALPVTASFFSFTQSEVLWADGRAAWCWQRVS